MSRDYKHTRNRRGGGMSGAAGLLLGLAIGLSVAAFVYLQGRTPSADAPAKPEPAKRPATEQAGEIAEEQTNPKYDFYEMLPRFEVVVPERNEKAEPSDTRPAIQRPGAYVLQVGSYRNFADADRVRAQLALQGLESKIQRVAIDNDTWHRVRIGPTADLTELNRTRERLRQADIEAIVVRVGE